jgi:O-antigen biosynthesis protein
MISWSEMLQANCAKIVRGNEKAAPSPMNSTAESSPGCVEPPQCLAFFLPQYHPIPENDSWWGSGFTEWRNVARALPKFRGHYQPRLPADLGFYDLRIPEVREQQADMARDAGLSAFVYYHYWFNGRRLLERPVEDMLASGRPDFPFCLAWANENWTRRWDGGDNEILIGQRYSAKDDLDHIRALRPALCDPRYFRLDGKPVLLIYRSSQLPDPVATTEIWRNEVRSWGLGDVYLLRIESFPSEVGIPGDMGFDAAVEFQPFWEHAPRPSVVHAIRRGIRERDTRFSSRLYRYEGLVEKAIGADRPSYVRWPGVTPGFDNSSRRPVGATIFTGSSPRSYQRWLRHALEKSHEMARQLHPPSRGLVFVNAWNEWAEGNHLEPDLRYGKSYLEATRSAVDEFTATLTPVRTVDSRIEVESA